MNIEEIKQRFFALNTAQICDSSSEIRVMHHRIHSLNADIKMAGIALTVKSNGNFETVLQALYEAKENDVLVIDGNNSKGALAGDIFASEAKRKNLGGIVIDGFCRDIEGIRQTSFPIFANGVCPKLATAENTGAIQTSIICGEVNVFPGDIIFGDENGVIVVKQNNVAKVLADAAAIAEKEKQILKKINAGISLEKLLNA